MNENKPIIAERIKYLRKEKGFTQEQLAEVLGLNAKSSIANYESGANSPSDDIKKKMCELFNCSMDYLMGLTSHKNPKEDLEKELYNFDLTESEYYDAINCFMSDTVQALSFVILFADENMVKTKEYNVLLTILSYVSDYIASTTLPNDKTSIDPLVKENLERELEKAYRPAKRLLLSLDKSKIIHNNKENITKIPILGTVKAGYDWLAEENVVDYITLKDNIPNINEYYALKVTGDSMLPLLSEGDLVIVHDQDDVESGQTAVVLINGEEATVKKVVKTNEGIELHAMNPYYPVKKFTFEDMKNIPVKIIGRVKEAKIKGAFE